MLGCRCALILSVSVLVISGLCIPNVFTETRSVRGFNTVTLEGSGQLVLEQAGTESLTITADDNLLPYLTSDVSDGHLTLGTKPGTNIDSSTPVRGRRRLPTVPHVRFLPRHGPLGISRLRLIPAILSATSMAMEKRTSSGVARPAMS
jgi:hypothetical protein